MSEETLKPGLKLDDLVILDMTSSGIFSFNNTGVARTTTETDTDDDRLNIHSLGLFEVATDEQDKNSRKSEQLVKDLKKGFEHSSLKKGAKAYNQLNDLLNEGEAAWYLGIDIGEQIKKQGFLKKIFGAPKTEEKTRLYSLSIGDMVGIRFTGSGTISEFVSENNSDAYLSKNTKTENIRPVKYKTENFEDFFIFGTSALSYLVSDDIAAAKISKAVKSAGKNPHKLALGIMDVLDMFDEDYSGKSIAVICKDDHNEDLISKRLFELYGKKDDASIAELESLIKKHHIKNLARPLVDIAEHYFQKDYEKSTKLLEAALRIHPGSRTAASLYAIVSKEGLWPSREKLTEAVSNIRKREQYIKKMQEQRDLDGAVAELKKLEEEHPHYSTPFIMHANLLIDSNRFDGLGSVMRTVYRDFFQDPDSIWKLQDKLEQKTKDIIASETDTSVFEELGNYYIRLRDWKYASEVFSAAISQAELQGSTPEHLNLSRFRAAYQLAEDDTSKKTIAEDIKNIALRLNNALSQKDLETKSMAEAWYGLYIEGHEPEGHEALNTEIIRPDHQEIAEIKERTASLSSIITPRKKHPLLPETSVTLSDEENIELGKYLSYYRETCFIRIGREKLSDDELRSLALYKDRTPDANIAQLAQNLLDIEGEQRELLAARFAGIDNIISETLSYQDDAMPREKRRLLDRFRKIGYIKSLSRQNIDYSQIYDEVSQMSETPDSSQIPTEDTTLEDIRKNISPEKESSLKVSDGTDYEASEKSKVIIQGRVQQISLRDGASTETPPAQTGEEDLDTFLNKIADGDGEQTQTTGPATPLADPDLSDLVDGTHKERQAREERIRTLLEIGKSPDASLEIKKYNKEYNSLVYRGSSLSEQEKQQMKYAFLASNVIRAVQVLSKDLTSMTEEMDIRDYMLSLGRNEQRLKGITSKENSIEHAYIKEHSAELEETIKKLETRKKEAEIKIEVMLYDKSVKEIKEKLDILTKQFEKDDKDTRFYYGFGNNISVTCYNVLTLEEKAKRLDIEYSDENKALVRKAFELRKKGLESLIKHNLEIIADVESKEGNDENYSTIIPAINAQFGNFTDELDLNTLARLRTSKDQYKVFKEVTELLAGELGLAADAVERPSGENENVVSYDELFEDDVLQLIELKSSAEFTDFCKRYPSAKNYVRLADILVSEGKGNNARIALILAKSYTTDESQKAKIDRYIGSLTGKPEAKRTIKHTTSIETRMEQESHEEDTSPTEQQETKPYLTRLKENMPSIYNACKGTAYSMAAAIGTGLISPLTGISVDEQNALILLSFIGADTYVNKAPGIKSSVCNAIMSTAALALTAITASYISDDVDIQNLSLPFIYTGIRAAINTIKR